ncbi:MAG TPA: helix-turn-helix transcriptional regulator [Verrucomicrobiae bacterium]|nr:helix-turn-helix transcriptional regulator [Verrucomicrobiae bacterium]
MTTTPRAVMTPQVADDPVALRIRTLRLSQGLSYKRLSEAAGGLATSFLFNIEHGRKVPGEDVAARIAVALGDGAYEQLYRAWARVKSRGRNGRADHEAMLGAWERLRAGFGVTDNGAGTPERKIDVVDGARDAGRLRVAVLATAADPGDGVRPGPELVVNTLSLDPSLYGHDATLARERYTRLRRPFAFPLDAVQAARAPGLPEGYLAVVTRETGEPPRRDAAYVVRVNGRLEVVPGSALAAGSAPEPLRASGLTDASALRGALVGRIDLLLPDVRR